MTATLTAEQANAARDDFESWFRERQALGQMKGIDLERGPRGEYQSCITRNYWSAYLACWARKEVELAELRAKAADSERLKYVYSINETDSDALCVIEFRMLNNEQPTIEEVRQAIDSAMKVSHDHA